jgi:hypothetical protein
VAAGETERFKSISVRYGTSLAECAMPEWQGTLDALQKLPEIGTEAPIGYGGGITLGTAIGIPLTAIEPRITAAIFGGGFVVHESLIEAARRVRVPIHFLLPWDNEYIDRQSALPLADGSHGLRPDLRVNPAAEELADADRPRRWARHRHRHHPPAAAQRPMGRHLRHWRPRHRRSRRPARHRRRISRRLEIDHPWPPLPGRGHPSQRAGRAAPQGRRCTSMTSVTTDAGRS